LADPGRLFPGRKEKNMNKARRAELSEILALIEEARERLEAVRDEEQEAFDNMPESLQYSARGEIMEEYVGIMDEFLDYLDTDELQNIAEG
jgi:hypothetical protein